MKSFIIAILVGLLFLTGCGSQKNMNIVQKKVVPTWYVNPPKTTLTTLYAIGEAANKDEAVANALNNMTSALSASVATQLNSEKLRISSYELLESTELGFRQHIVLITSDKQKLFESLKSELEQKFALIEKETEPLDRYHAIKQLSIYSKAKSNVQNVENTLIVMNVLNSGFDGKEYLDKASRINSDYDKLISSITFTIESNSEAKNLESLIANGLSEKKLQIKYGTGKKHFVITVTSKNQKAFSRGFTIASAEIDIRTRDYRGSVIGSNKLNIIGESTQGYEIAKENVAIKLNEMIKKDGIANVIGLDL
ncbi:LPP20 family lipoprotein [Sulfurimonas sp.]|uniref:LPP20 family lipoprotein n=1 Tax=Sulfurimonas sp. TaxID=2022749 RepID=UPI00261E5F4B|nr:LPP20 family lipoprotein [Sulfurimonas sp.]MCW8895243.1 LPP20 family lipoprotein [Sulfurimonas sp.]MCW9067594.1 LPP20 family lipoprotein [Sulfurimonas sp.]